MGLIFSKCAFSITVMALARSTGSISGALPIESDASPRDSTLGRNPPTPSAILLSLGQLRVMTPSIRVVVTPEPRSPHIFIKEAMSLSRSRFERCLSPRTGAAAAITYLLIIKYFYTSHYNLNFYCIQSASQVRVHGSAL